MKQSGESWVIVSSRQRGFEFTSLHEYIAFHGGATQWNSLEEPMELLLRTAPHQSKTKESNSCEQTGI
jgi:hypothetical protein